MWQCVARSPFGQLRFVVLALVGVQGSQGNHGDEEQRTAIDAAVLHSAPRLETWCWALRTSAWHQVLG